MKKSTNYKMNIVEGSDVVNLLTQMNPNTEIIDETMKNNELTGIQTATELFLNKVHAITRNKKDCNMFKFTAVSKFTSGDTFTVDGVSVTALLTSGEQLGTGAFIIGSEVLCSLKGTLLTIFSQSGSITLSEDSEKLGGKLPEYYAKNEDIEELTKKLPTLYQDDKVFNIKLGSISTKITITPDTTYSINMPTPPTGYSYDQYKTFLTIIASSNGLPYVYYNLTITGNTCNFKLKSLSGDRYDGDLYVGVTSIMVPTVLA